MGTVFETYPVAKDSRILRADTGLQVGAGVNIHLEWGIATAADGHLYRRRILVRYPLTHSTGAYPGPLIWARCYFRSATPAYIEPEGVPKGGTVKARQLTAGFSEGTYGSSGTGAFSTTNAVVWPGPAKTNTDEATLNFAGGEPDPGDWWFIDVSAIFQNWMDGDTNYGLEIRSGNDDGTNSPAFTSTAGNMEVYARESGAGDSYIQAAFQVGSVPTAPVVSSPAGGAIVEAGTALSGTAGPPAVGTVPTTKFTFTVSDPDGDAIDAYNIQVANNPSFSGFTGFFASGLAWASGSTHTVTIAASQPRGAHVYWRVQVNDAVDGWGPFSPTADYYIGSASTPAMLAPAGGQLARLAMGAGRTYPWFYLGWTYSDPRGQAQGAYRTRLYADSAGSLGGLLADSGFVAGSVASAELAYASIAEGAYYWLSIETQNAQGLSNGESAKVRVRARWARGNYYYDCTSPPTSWSVTSQATIPANAAVFLEYGSSSSTTPPGTYTPNLGTVAPARYFHYRVWLFAWGAASPTTPTLDKLTLSFTSATIQPDRWTNPLPTGASVDTSEFVYGTQSLKLTGQGGGSPVSVKQPIDVTPNTDYILSARIKVQGAPSARVRLLSAANALLTDALGNNVQATGPSATTDWARYASPVWNSGGQTQVQIEAIVDAGAGNTAWFDAFKFEASTVVTPWSPGFVGSGVAIDAGGLQIDGSQGSVARFRASTGGARDIVQLGAHGLMHGPTADGVEVYSPAAGVLQVGGALTRDGAQWETGVTSPAQLTADQNDWAPTGWGNSTRTLRVDTNAARNLTGLAGGAAGRNLRVVNISTSSITLKHENASSAAANRFTGPGGADVVVRTLGSVDLWYDGVSSRWRALAI